LLSRDCEGAVFVKVYARHNTRPLPNGAERDPFRQTYQLPKPLSEVPQEAERQSRISLA
jgi:hypothetical protein